MFAAQVRRPVRLVSPRKGNAVTEFWSAEIHFRFAVGVARQEDVSKPSDGLAPSHKGRTEGGGTGKAGLRCTSESGEPAAKRK